MSRHWPLSDLRLRTARVELRVPTPEDLETLADLAAAGVHDPAVMPFTVPWTDVSPADRARSVLQWQWRLWSEWTPARWRLELAVLADTGQRGRQRQVVGTQSVYAERFGVLGEVSTGSWLGLRFQGRGIGTEMRAAVLHLAFAELGARYALSDAFDDNAASLGVSRRLGYRPDGIVRTEVRDKPGTLRRLRLDRATWRTHRTAEVTMEGLAGCRDMFGRFDGPGSHTGD